MKKGVLIIAFGGPRDEEDIPPFLEEVTGSTPTETMIEEVRSHYRSIGGSPFHAILERIVEGIRRRIPKVEVGFGFLYGRPRIEEAMEELEKRGVLEVLAFPLTPYRSPQMEEGLRRAQGMAEELILELRKPRPWAADPEYGRLWAQRLRDGLPGVGKVQVLFTAHSLPEDSSAQYLEDIKGAIEATMAFFPGLPWGLAFHGSRPGWLGPGLKEALKGVEKGKAQRVVVVPIGFVCDHLETLYDLDVMLKEEADSLGILLERVSCLNASEDFLNFLGKKIYEALK